MGEICCGDLSIVVLVVEGTVVDVITDVFVNGISFNETFVNDTSGELVVFSALFLFVVRPVLIYKNTSRDIMATESIIVPKLAFLNNPFNNPTQSKFKQPSQ